MRCDAVRARRRGVEGAWHLKGRRARDWAAANKGELVVCAK